MVDERRVTVREVLAMAGASLLHLPRLPRAKTVNAVHEHGLRAGNGALCRTCIARRPVRRAADPGRDPDR